MIGWEDVYKVVAAMAPLYFALGLGYCSVRWWKLYTREQCDALNHLATYFAIPFFAFDFTARMDPDAALNYRVLAADALSKVAIVLALAAWAAASIARHGAGSGLKFASSWGITGYSLAALNGSLVVGVPLMDELYGKWARDLVMQLTVLQFVFYFPLLMLAFEVRRASGGGGAAKPDEVVPARDDVEGGVQERRPELLIWPLVRVVLLNLARNPIVYAGVLGVAWSSVTRRCVFGLSYFNQSKKYLQ
jgi:auxin efflux carrier family